jgi:hypothetical protein
MTITKETGFKTAYDRTTILKYIQVLERLGVIPPWEFTPFVGQKTAEEFVGYHLKEYPYLFIFPGNGKAYWTLYRHPGSETCLEGIVLKICDIFEPITIILNKEYTATVEKDCVRVGCQTFPFGAIELLAECVKRVKQLTK